MVYRKLLCCCGWILGHHNAVARLLWVVDKKVLFSCYSEWLPGSCYSVAIVGEWLPRHCYVVARVLPGSCFELARATESN